MTWLGKLFKGQLGWKTVTSALALAVIALGWEFGWISAEQAQKYLALGGALGLVGLRDALSKLQGK